MSLFLVGINIDWLIEIISTLGSNGKQVFFLPNKIEVTRIL